KLYTMDNPFTQGATPNLQALATSQTATVIRVPVITITSQPSTAIFTHNQTPNPLSVVATSENLPAGFTISYQWQSLSPFTNRDDYSNIPGATSASYTPPASSVDSYILYRVIISVLDSTATPITTTTSAQVSVTITSPLTPVTINRQPASATYLLGQTRPLPIPIPLFVEFATPPANTMVTYQWQSSLDPTFGFVNILGATARTLTLPPITAPITKYYRVIITSRQAGRLASVTSAVAAITATTVPDLTILPVITIQPERAIQVKSANSRFTITTSATCPNYATVSYRYQYSKTGKAWSWKLLSTSAVGTLTTQPSSFAPYYKNTIPNPLYMRVRVFCLYNLPNGAPIYTNIYSTVTTIRY
ncbi:MAG: hypothetical protein QM538_03900, partial [Methylacidiphilales bacterium]|nr:hypothetical protein [Candidatus Methylacidiphilales bacterium]